MCAEQQPPLIRVQPYEAWRESLMERHRAEWEKCMHCAFEEPEFNEDTGEFEEVDCFHCGGAGGWLRVLSSDPDEPDEIVETHYKAYRREVFELIRNICVTARWDFFTAAGQFIKSGAGLNDGQ